MNLQFGLGAKKTKMLPVLVFSLVITACGKPEISEHPSPNGQYILSLAVRDPGAMGTATATVQLRGNDDGTQNVNEEIFRGDGWPFEVRWVGDAHAVITACDANQIKLRRIFYPAGSTENKINFQLVTEPDTIINQTAYCVSGKKPPSQTKPKKDVR